MPKSTLTRVQGGSTDTISINTDRFAGVRTMQRTGELDDTVTKIRVTVQGHSDLNGIYTGSTVDYAHWYQQGGNGQIANNGLNMEQESVHWFIVDPSDGQPDQDTDPATNWGGGITATRPWKVSSTSGVVIKPADTDTIHVHRTGTTNTGDQEGESRPILSKVAGGATFAFAFYDLFDIQGNAKIANIRRSGDNATKTFYAKDFSKSVEEWVGAGNDGYVRFWYNQADNETHWVGIDGLPKIVSNGSLIKDPNNKIAMDGKGARMRLSKNETGTLSSDGTHSVFLVGNFPTYSNATKDNIQILNINSSGNGGANNTRKPFITINKIYNRITSAVGTSNVGTNSTGNAFATYTSSNHQLITSIANPNKATNNNEIWLDGKGVSSVDNNTVINTSPDTPNTCFLFDAGETTATTHLSSMIYYPNDQRINVDALHHNLLNQHIIA